VNALESQLEEAGNYSENQASEDEGVVFLSEGGEFLSGGESEQ